MVGMALEHALLVALCEQPASGLDLTKRFGRSIGFFWSATHQQIYRVLGRMDGDGWVSVEAVAQEGQGVIRCWCSASWTAVLYVSTRCFSPFCRCSPVVRSSACVLSMMT